MGQACILCDPHQFWSNPQLFQLLSNSVFSYLEYIDNSDMKLLMEYFLPAFVENCPQQLWFSLLNQVLVSFYVTIHDRLNNCWSKIYERTNGYAKIDILTLL